ncbi:MAG: hypothetical protein KF744_14255 [Taibaiella sp.]|nr:hypothetical protein [Taibaiella sp.]
MIRISFIVLTAIMAGILIAGINRAARQAELQGAGKRLLRETIVGLITWLSYVAAISFSGVLQTAALPPRIPAFLILPLFVFILFIFRTQIFRRLLAATPAHFLIYPQVFRIGVELLLHQMYKDGLIPRSATFEGYNYEIVIAILSLGVGYLAHKRKAPRLITAWNIAGLGTLFIVVFIFISRAYAQNIYGSQESLSIKDFGSFPYTLLPGFLMPLAVFLHVASLAKQRMLRSQ